MKRILFIAIALLFGCLIAGAAWYYSKLNRSHTAYRSPTGAAGKQLLTRLTIHAHPLLTYARQHGYNTTTCFLVDMSIGSGSNRFFVYDMKKDSISDAGLVAHGCCNKDWLAGRQYGNEVGCGCTSLGKYKIGNPYKGKFGRAYKLHGLDSSNSNAFARFVVLHSFTAVPDKEVEPLPICQSNGCPMVSASFLQKLSTIVDHSAQPVLLYIFDKN